MSASHIAIEYAQNIEEMDISREKHDDNKKHVVFGMWSPMVSMEKFLVHTLHSIN